MYKSNLNVSIYSKDNLIYDTISEKEYLSEIKKGLGYTFDITVIDDINAPVVNSDIYILDLPFEELKESTLSNYKTEASMLIVCLDLGKFDNVPQDVYDLIDGIWYRPYTPSYIRFNFGILAKQMNDLHTCLFEQACLNTIMESSADLAWIKDLFGTYKKVNSTFCETFSKSHDEIEGKDDFALLDLDPDVVPEYKVPHIQTDSIVIQSEKRKHFDEETMLTDGKHIFKTYKCPLINELHEILGTVGVSRDVTNVDNLNAELDILAEAVPFPLLIIDLEGYPIKANKNYLALFDFKLENIARHSMYNFATFNHRPDMKWEVKNSDGTNYLLFEHKRYKVEKDELLDIFGDRIGYIYILVDITMEDTYRKLLQQAANTDYLTKLNNRHRLDTYLKEVTGHRKLSLLSFNLENFKLVNDIYGHSQGDLVLISFANILRDFFPAEKLFRLGGNHFLAVFVDDISTDQLEYYAEKIAEKMHSTLSKSYEKANLSVRVGLSTESRSISAIDKIFKKADSLLYKEKPKAKI